MDTVEEVARRLQEGGLGPHPNTGLNQLGVMLIRELSKGEPLPVPPLDAVAVQLGIEVAELTQLVERLTERDEAGQIVGVAGLSLSPTRHKFIVEGRTLYTWCTLDGLYMAPILKKTSRIETRCPATDKPITVTVHPDGTGSVSPEGALMSMTIPSQACGPREVSDIRASFCDFVHFLSSPEALNGWKPEGADVEAMSMDDGFALGLLLGEGFLK